MSKGNMVDTLIDIIKKDQALLGKADEKIEAAKDEKREIADRLKEHRRDLEVMVKYASVDQQKQIDDLGFDFTASDRGMNPVASLALDIVMKAKDNRISNGDLYEAYVKTFKNADDAFSYTEFNIKTRSLFNTQRLLRKKGTDAKNSRIDIISLNGRVVEKKETKQAKVPIVKTTSNSSTKSS